jgi:hypothetical protein
MNCPQCQVESAPDAAYCRNCGARVSPAAGTSPQAGTGFSQAPFPPAREPAYPPPGGPANSQPGGPVYSQPGGAGYPRSASGIPPVSLDLSRLSTVDKVVAGATLVTMISIWLPWFTGSVSLLGVTDSASVSGTGYHGWLWLEFFVALLLIAYLVARALWETLPVSLPVGHERLLIAGTGLQFLLILIGFFTWPSNTVVDGIVVTFSLSAGAFLGLIFSIVAAAPVIVPAVRSYLESRNAAGGSRSY